MRNLFKRGRVWYVRATVNGKRISQSLQTTQIAEARSRAKKIIAAARAEKWDLLNQLQARKIVRVPTIREICSAYETLAAARRLKHGSPRPDTVTGNVNQLINVVGAVHGRDCACTLSCSVLTRKLLDSYAEGFLSLCEPDNLALERGRLTVYSTIQQAKGVLVSWALREYRECGLGLPDLDEFLEYQPVAKPDLKYKFPPVELVEKTQRCGNWLRGTEPELYLAYLLCHDLGLRSGAASAARWDWIQEFEGAYYMHVQTREDWNTKSRNYRVRLAPLTWTCLQDVRQSEPFILPGDTPAARRNLVERDLAKWMREIGWDRETYSKAAHELRKLAGARWYTHHGLEVAAEWLGDNPETVYKFYADLDPRKPPEPVLASA